MNISITIWTQPLQRHLIWQKNNCNNREVWERYSMKKKLLFIMSNLQNGGAEVVL